MALPYPTPGPLPIPAWIAAIPGLLTGQRSWACREKQFPRGVTYLPGPTVTVPVLELLLHTGLALTPCTSPTDPAAWYAALRFAQVLTDGPTNPALMARVEVDRADSRLKAILAEEISIGMCHWLLYNKYDVAHIADAGPFLARALGGGVYTRKSLRSRGMYGPGGGYKPDFFCLTATGEAVLAESKGAFGTVGLLGQPLKKGKKQVKNVRPVGCALRNQANRLVFASNIPIQGINRRSRANTVILDPDEAGDALDVPITSEQIARRSYSNVLRMAGFYEVADAFELGEERQPLRQLQRESVTIDNDRHVPLSEFGNGWWFSLREHVWRAISTQGRIVPALAELTQVRSYRSERAYIMPNGFGLIRDQQLEGRTALDDRRVMYWVVPVGFPHP